MSKKKVVNPWGMLGQSSDDGITHVDLLIHGRSGAGKTYRAGTSPSPFILSPDPTGHKAIPYSLPGRVVNTLEEIMEVVEWFEEGGHVEQGIQTLIVDGLSFIYDLYLKEVGEYMATNMGAKDPDLLPINAYNKIIAGSKRMLRRMINLTQVPDKANRVHVVFTTLEERLKEDERAQYQVRPMFGSKSMNDRFPALFSIIGYVFPVGEDEEGKPTQARKMLFTEYNGIMAKDRLNIFSPFAEEAPNLSHYLK